MNKLTLILFGLVSSLCLVACTGDIDGFTDTGSSSTNIISANNFTVAASELNPKVFEFDTAVVDALDAAGATTANVSDLQISHTGIEVTLTVTAADKNNLLVTSGTIYFRTQHGFLESDNCELGANGTCEVTWRSNGDATGLLTIPLDGTFDVYNSITVWTMGEESYIDSNGNGEYDNGDIGFYETEEPYVDNDDNYSYTSGDILIDVTITDGAHNTGDGFFNGSDCTHSTDCSSTQRIPIFATNRLKLYAASSGT